MQIDSESMNQFMKFSEAIMPDVLYGVNAISCAASEVAQAEALKLRLTSTSKRIGMPFLGIKLLVHEASPAGIRLITSTGTPRSSCLERQQS